jgi:AcrR family transcriptional regulator
MVAKDRPKSQQTRKRIIRAAARIVAREGYPKASVAKIATEAGIAHGSFYYYFARREDLFRELLPALGEEMIQFISERVEQVEWGLERELAGFKAYFEFMAIRPEFYRVFTEAQVFVPEAYTKHFRNVMNNYVRALEHQRESGYLTVGNGELEVLAYALTGIRNYITQLIFSANSPRQIPPSAFDLYRRVLAEGVFKQ